MFESKGARGAKQCILCFLQYSIHNDSHTSGWGGGGLAVAWWWVARFPLSLFSMGVVSDPPFNYICFDILSATTYYCLNTSNKATPVSHGSCRRLLDTQQPRICRLCAFVYMVPTWLRRAGWTTRMVSSARTVLPKVKHKQLCTVKHSMW
jgi:hypothetical protein